LILNRIKEYKNFNSDKELADFLGITTQNLSNWKSRNTLDFEIIFTKCVDVNSNWLLNGNGEMMLNNYYSSNYLVDREVRIVSEIENQYLRPTVEKGIPIVPFEAFGGFGDEDMEGVNIENIQEKYVVPLFHGIKIDFMIPVRGSSMYPKYNSGDVVACRIISELMFIQWNKVYVIDTISQGTIIKRLKKSIVGDNVICKSDNKDYDEFELPKSDIRTIAMVVGVIRIE